jgi:hypothetical protein
MALADRLKSLFKQGGGAVASHKDQAHQAVDKVAAEANKRTGGRYDDQIDKAEKKADEAIEQMDDPAGRGQGAHPPGGQGAGEPGGPGGNV